MTEKPPSQGDARLRRSEPNPTRLGSVSAPTTGLEGGAEAGFRNPFPWPANERARKAASAAGKPYSVMPDPIWELVRHLNDRQNRHRIGLWAARKAQDGACWARIFDEAEELLWQIACTAAATVVAPAPVPVAPSARVSPLCQGQCLPAPLSPKILARARQYTATATGSRSQAAK